MSTRDGACLCQKGSRSQSRRRVRIRGRDISLTRSLCRDLGLTIRRGRAMAICKSRKSVYPPTFLFLRKFVFERRKEEQNYGGIGIVPLFGLPTFSRSRKSVASRLKPPHTSRVEGPSPGDSGPGPTARARRRRP